MLDQLVLERFQGLRIYDLLMQPVPFFNGLSFSFNWFFSLKSCAFKIFFLYFYCCLYYRCPHFPPLCPPLPSSSTPFPLAIPTLFPVSMSYAHIHALWLRIVLLMSFVITLHEALMILQYMKYFSKETKAVAL